MTRMSLLAAFLIAVPAAAQVHRPTGTVDVASGPIACDGQECYDITVSCPEVAAPAKARLKVGGTAEKGTILFASSGFGTDLYEGQGQEKPRILNDLRTAGFQTVQLQWAENWFGGSPGAEEGFVRLACRPATVAQWVHDNLHTPSESTAMCATGHSGGAAQVSYMLSHYGLEDILSLVVPTGGPPMARVDLLCSADPANAAFKDVAEWAKNLMDIAFGFPPLGDRGTASSGPCARADATFTERFRLASVASGGGDYVHPQTLVWFAFEGIADDSGAVAQGELYHDLLVSEGSPLIRKDTVPGVTHAGATGLYNSREGTNLIRDILINECRPHMP